MSEIEKRLLAHGIELDAPPGAVANYVPIVKDGPLLIVSGQLPLKGGKLMYEGRLGETVDTTDGQEAARLCAINLLAQLKGFLGDLDQLERCLRLGGFIASLPSFYDHALVMNGASDLMVDALGDAGRHARAAVGCACLPLNSAVEVEGLFRVRA